MKEVKQHRPNPIYQSNNKTQKTIVDISNIDNTSVNLMQNNKEFKEQKYPAFPKSLNEEFKPKEDLNFLNQ